MFGRRKDEDPFAALKHGATYQSPSTNAADIGLGSGEANLKSQATAQSTSAPARPPPAPPRASPMSPGVPQPRRRASGYRRGSGGGSAVMWRLLIAMFVIAAGVIPLLALGHATHSIKIPSFNFDSTTGTGSGGITPTAPSRTSYLSSAGLRAGLARIERIAPHARLALLRIDVRSLSTSAVLRGGVAKQIYFGPSGTFVAAGTATGEPPVPISKIKATAINRLLAGMRRRFHAPSSRIDYILLSSEPGQSPRWIVFTKTARHPGYSATLNGTNLAPL